MAHQELASWPTLVVVRPSVGVPHASAFDEAAHRYRCVHCWASSSDELRLARRTCAAPSGTGHVVMRVGPFIFCRTCGAMSKGNVLKLAQPCTGRPPRSRVRLQFLCSGKDPYSGQHLGEAEAVEVSSYCFLPSLCMDGH